MGSGDTDPPAGGLTVLFLQHRAELLRFLCARCGNRDAADDLLQELWLKASAQPSGPVANGRAYLFRMANNLALDARRSQHRAMTRDRGWLEVDGHLAQNAEDRPDPALPADEAIAERQEAEIIRRAIATLPPGARRALELYRLESKPQAEIAAIMGIGRSGVEKHLAVAMKHLRNALADCGSFGPAASNNQQRNRGGEPQKDQRQ